MADGTVNIIRKIEVVEGHGHHGGAWKVAYADFMTAMMAFFLLMWILSSSDEQKLRGIAEYFTNATLPGGSGVLDGATLGPPGTMTASNGATVARGAEFGEVDDPSPAKWEVMDTTPTADPEMKTRGTSQGHHENPASGAASETFQTNATDDAVTNKHLAGDADENTDATQLNSSAGAEGPEGDAGAKNVAQNASEADAASQVDQSKMMAAGDIENQNPDHTADIQRFEDLETKILQAMQASPDLAPLQENIVFERTPDGMLIQIIDKQGKPMFSSGSAKMNDATIKLMALLGDSLTQLPNNMVISGHTDAVPFTNRKAYDNWDLSTDRANAMRRVLLENGVTKDRITRVSGMADTQLLKPEAPKDATNRRIEVMLAYEKLKAPAKAPMPMADKIADKPESAMASKDGMENPADEMMAKDTMAKPAEAMVAKPAMEDTVAPSVAEALVAPEPASLLDETVFQNLRSALR